MGPSVSYRMIAAIRAELGPRHAERDERLGERGAVAPGRVTQRSEVVVGVGAERAAQPGVDLVLRQRAGQRLEQAARRSWNTLRGNSRLKNVHSHFSYCDAAGST